MASELIFNSFKGYFYRVIAAYSDLLLRRNEIGNKLARLYDNKMSVINRSNETNLLKHLNLHLNIYF